MPWALRSSGLTPNKGYRMAAWMVGWIDGGLVTRMPWAQPSSALCRGGGPPPTCMQRAQEWVVAQWAQGVGGMPNGRPLGPRGWWHAPTHPRASSCRGKMVCTVLSREELAIWQWPCGQQQCRGCVQSASVACHGCSAQVTPCIAHQPGITRAQQQQWHLACPQLQRRGVAHARPTHRGTRAICAHRG